MSSGYENPVLEPPLSDWPAALQTLANAELQTLRTSARRRLIQAAHAYRQRLTEIGRRTGLLTQKESLLTGDADSCPIIMTGHQPVFFHSGLTFKYETAEKFAAAHHAVGVAIVIDTDEGDAGSFSFPACTVSVSEADRRASATTLHTQSTTFGQDSSLYCAGRKGSSGDIRKEAVLVAAGLNACGCEPAALSFTKVAEQYAAIDTDSMMEANLIVRWNAAIGGRLLELPLSVLCGFPEVMRFFVEILSRPFEFAQCYNSSLDEFRRDQKIRNEANPFPNLRYQVSQTELPFWIVDTAAGTRQIVSVRQAGFERTLETPDGLRIEILPGNESASLFSLLVSGRCLIPRGALITAAMRLLFSDLFVHGTGGGRYDRFTDRLIKKWWNVEPTPFAVASASRYLFGEERMKLAHLQKISEQLRDLQFNPQRYLGTAIFSAHTEALLQAKLSEKETAIGQLKTARENGLSAQEIGRQIQQLSDTIKTIVTAAFEGQLKELNAIPPESMAVWTSRTWPWMFFE
jgi:hypothetical protein